MKTKLQCTKFVPKQAEMYQSDRRYEKSEPPQLVVFINY